MGSSDLYINGVYEYTFTTPLRIFGMQALAGVAESTGAPSDVLDGDILGFASYDSALTATEVRTHADAFAIPEPSAIALVGFVSLGFFGRRRR